MPPMAQNVKISSVIILQSPPDMIVNLIVNLANQKIDIKPRDVWKIYSCTFIDRINYLYSVGP